jgi:hypothetical protein
MKEVKLRRYRNLLTISGLGVIAFGLWSVLKTILLFVFREEALAALPDDVLTRVIFFVIVGVLLLTDFAIRLFIGLSARAEGLGKKKGYAYLVFAVLLALASAASVAAIFFDTGTTSILEIIVSVIVEVTSLVAVIELIAAAIHVKRLGKECGEAM